MRRTLRLVVVLAVATLVAACAGAGGAAPVAEEPSNAAASVVPTPTPESTIKNITVTLPPREMTDGEGDEVVAGAITDVIQTEFETYAPADGYQEVRGGQVVGTHLSNDVRADGKTTFDFNVDFYEKSGPMWGTVTIVNDNGSWSGRCLGASIASGQLGPMDCWLAGSGAYEGWTYYQSTRTDTGGVGAATLGVIYEGEAPAR